MKKELILIGGGGHCCACIDVIEQEAKYHIHGILDLPEKIGEELLGYPLIGTDVDIPSYIEKNFAFIITAGHLGNTTLRDQLWHTLESHQAEIVSIVSPRAYVSKHAKIGIGTIVMHDALVNANASVGNNCIINTKALIEHDALIADHVHISTAAVINGGVQVNSGAFIGSHATSKQGVVIPEKSFIKAGSVTT